MKVRLACFLSAALLCLLAAAPTHAQDRPGFLKSVGVDTARNNCWPEPFICPDRFAVRAPFVLMVQNGWRRQNLLAEQHFAEGDQHLNEAGQIKVRWILTEAPEQHRTLYVRRGDTPQVTAARIAAVQQLAGQVLAPGQLPDIEETSISAVGWPAERVDVLERKFESTTPEPRLPQAQSESDTAN